MKPLGLGHAVLCAKHLLNVEPFAVLILDQISLGMSHGFFSGTQSLECNRVGQAMVERVSAIAVENYGVVDKGGCIATPFRVWKSIS